MSATVAVLRIYFFKVKHMDLEGNDDKFIRFECRKSRKNNRFLIKAKYVCTSEQLLVQLKKKRYTEMIEQFVE